MTGFVEIVVVAAVAQLAVLPGEKVQFIIAGLSTRYRPALVVGAAGSAFAGWTAVEILLGETVQRLLPAVVLDGFTAALFVLFAVLLVRSTPGGAETDGGVTVATAPAIDPEFDVLGRTIEGSVGRFLAVFAMMAAGEFGDKTQLVTIGLAAQYGAHPAIWFGEMAAIIPVSMANAFFFHKFAHRFNLRIAHYVGASLFAFFGVDTLFSVLFDYSVWETVTGWVARAILSLV